MRRAAASRRRLGPGFTLVEMIVVVLLMSIAMLGILAVFDASARINKSETDVADAQGAVRYGVYTMTRAIRMAGTGGLFLTQAVLNHRDPDLPGITVVNSADATSYDNVQAGTTVTNLSGTAVPVRPGTDMIEVRGVFFSPLLAFDEDAANGCQSASGQCVGAVPVDAKATTNFGHVNDDAANRPQFAAIDAYTAGVSAANPMLVVVTGGGWDIHTGCSGSATQVTPYRYEQLRYNVGVITAPTQLAVSGTFGTVDFGYTGGGFNVVELDNENPADSAVALGGYPNALQNPITGGVLDDVLFFVDDTDPLHPGLAQATRRGTNFDVVRIADDVEDMQIAYGVDTNGDNAVTRTIAVNPPNDIDPNVSTQVNGDEWVPNVSGETALLAVQFQSDPAPGTFPHPAGTQTAHCPRLHGVMISLVAKSRDPDPTYKADGSLGFRVMNSPVSINPPFPDVAAYPTPPAEPHYRRRIQTLKINLRNFAFEQ